MHHNEVKAMHASRCLFLYQEMLQVAVVRCADSKLVEGHLCLDVDASLFFHLRTMHGEPLASEYEKASIASMNFPLM